MPEEPQQPDTATSGVPEEELFAKERQRIIDSIDLSGIDLKKPLTFCQWTELYWRLVGQQVFFDDASVFYDKEHPFHDPALLSHEEFSQKADNAHMASIGILRSAISRKIKEALVAQALAEGGFTHWLKDLRALRIEHNDIVAKNKKLMAKLAEIRDTLNNILDGYSGVEASIKQFEDMAKSAYDDDAELFAVYSRTARQLTAIKALRDSLK